MEGGKILGEGVDGCILTEPMWPCTSESHRSTIPNLESKDYISKIVPKQDNESIYRKSAEHLLGSLSPHFMTLLKDQCIPADTKHPPRKSEEYIYSFSEHSVKGYRPDGEACSLLKQRLEDGKEIAESHKVLYISRYLMNVKDLVSTTNQSTKSLLDLIIPAIYPFLKGLQRLYNQESEQLIHLDLHAGNITVKLNPLLFGITDFGQCLLRRSSDTKERQSRFFIGKYLCNYIARFVLFEGYPQCPFEARLLNYCFINNKYNEPPSVLIKSWEHEIKKSHNSISDYFELNISSFLDELIKKPMFISMVETIQSISKKLRENEKNISKLVDILSSQEKIAIEYILTRYLAISPINCITNAISVMDESRKENTVHSYLKKTIEQSKLSYLTSYLRKMITAPYLQTGSSLSVVLKSVQAMDITIVWNDILKESL